MNKLELIGKKGIIANYRRGRHTVHPKHCILVFSGITTRKDANKLIGRTVVWYSSSGKELKGKISRAHGNSGAVRAHFKKKGVPGQALGQKITIIK
ncbi:MAG: 50S ribosomal protein L35Ae [Promethearchaeota archaeon]|nr:MAG: 50S ribosomal protein L35Ae [Candidatus Lokiarchaeota archaeon]